MTTTVVAIRHARPHGDGLSEEGRQDAWNVATNLKVQPTTIYTSPLTRAHQTATIFAEVLGGEVVLEEGLVDFDGERLLSLVKPGHTTLFVGHDPTIAEFVNQLIGQARYSGLLKSQAIVVQFDHNVGWGRGEVRQDIRP